MKIPVDPNVKAGFRAARTLTRYHAKTFYFASHFLAPDKREASYAVYAVCRLSDEAVDNPSGQNQEDSLARLQHDINLAYRERDCPLPPLIAAFCRTTRTYEIPKTCFEELIEGMRMDLRVNRYRNFKELYQYCYRAAGVVGLIMLRIFGSTSRDAQGYAEKMGIAMQLTNILRDIAEDYRRGRLYLPLDELARFNVSEKKIADCTVDAAFIELMKFQIDRARAYYAESTRGLRLISDARARIVATVMQQLYAGILDDIEQNQYDVFTRRAHVPLWKKLLMTARILLKRSPDEDQHC